MVAKLQAGLNLPPGTGLNSWFFLLKDSQSVTHLRQTVYAPGRKVPLKRHHPFLWIWERGEQKIELTPVIPLDSH